MLQENQVPPALRDELFARLDAIAAKLGVAAEHLWEVLVRQAYMEWFSVLGWCLAAVILYLMGKAMAQFVYHMSYSGMIDPPSYRTKRSDEEAVKLSTEYKGIAQNIANMVVGIVVACGVISRMVIALSASFNPEYFAFKEIMKLLR
jgi:hypothetical protein